ncbi:hypothetical protein GF327_09550 [Candidatus Woesearchaeota archaeon]|nr:hypothetical protein [Candidatus Woesearchaeota archaeon]
MGLRTTICFDKIKTFKNTSLLKHHDMKLTILFSMIILLIGGCLPEQEESSIQASTETPFPLLDEHDLLQLGMHGDCRVEQYENDKKSSLVHYSFCNYTVKSLDAEIIVELSKYNNLEDLNGSYQYNSLHLRSSEGLINENEYGDQSRFSVNNEDDYGGEFNEPGIYYYHLWIVKNLYLIHITSKGSKDAKEHISEIGLQILTKFK